MGKTKPEARIATRLASNLLTCKFEAAVPVHPGGAHFFRGVEDAKESPLAQRIFALGGIVSVKLAGSTVAVTRESSEDWPSVTRKIAPLIEEQLSSGRPAVAAGAASNMRAPAEIRKKVEEILETQINPAVASHGGVISLIDVKDATVFVKLGGGCQGCGMANVTLKQGVEQAFRQELPEIDDVLDVTDHASGDNPYYAPSKK